MFKLFEPVSGSMIEPRVVTHNMKAVADTLYGVIDKANEIRLMNLLETIIAVHPVGYTLTQDEFLEFHIACVKSFVPLAKKTEGVDYCFVRHPHVPWTMPAALNERDIKKLRCRKFRWANGVSLTEGYYIDLRCIIGDYG